MDKMGRISCSVVLLSAHKGCNVIVSKPSKLRLVSQRVFDVVKLIDMTIDCVTELLHFHKFV